MQEAVYFQVSENYSLMRQFFRWRTVSLLVCCLLALTACTKPTTKKAITTPAAANVTAPSAIGQDSTSAVSPTQETMEVFKKLSPPEGVRLTPLFTTPLKTEDRVARLEGIVQQMHDNFDTVLPAMVRMVGVEGDMKELVTVLKGMSGRDGAVAAAPTEEVLPPEVIQAMKEEGITPTNNSSSSPQPLVAEPKVVTPPPPVEEEKTQPSPAQSSVSSDALTVKDIRVGNKPDSGRIVLDITKSVKASTRIENGGKTVVIKLADAASWSGKTAWQNKGKGLVAGWQAEGDKLSIDLLAPAILAGQSLLEPNKESPYYRLVIDVMQPKN